MRIQRNYLQEQVNDGITIAAANSVKSSLFPGVSMISVKLRRFPRSARWLVGITDPLTCNLYNCGTWSKILRSKPRLMA